MGDIWDTSDIWRSPCGQLYSPIKIRGTLKKVCMFLSTFCSFSKIWLSSSNVWHHLYRINRFAIEYFLWVSTVFGASHIKISVSLTILKKHFSQFFLNKICWSRQFVLGVVKVVHLHWKFVYVEKILDLSRRPIYWPSFWLIITYFSVV